VEPTRLSLDEVQRHLRSACGWPGASRILSAISGLTKRFIMNTRIARSRMYPGTHQGQTVCYNAFLP
jgi:hypothetical protein